MFIIGDILIRSNLRWFCRLRSPTDLGFVLLVRSLKCCNLASTWTGWAPLLRIFLRSFNLFACLFSVAISAGVFLSFLSYNISSTVSSFLRLGLELWLFVDELLFDKVDMSSYAMLLWSLNDCLLNRLFLCMVANWLGVMADDVYRLIRLWADLTNESFFLASRDKSV